jgi:translation initiation factor 6
VAVGLALYGGSPYLGVYLRVAERCAILPPSIPHSLERDVRRLLDVNTERTTVLDNEVIGSMIAMTSHGAVVGDELDPIEREAIERVVPVTVVRCRQNAMGNNVLANDHGALVHPEVSETATEAIGRALGVPARRGTLAGLGTVGMCGVATNRGVVVHPKTTEIEAGIVAELLRVPVHRSTANFGVPIVGACLIANSKAMIAGRPTTPVEIVHLQEGFQLFD